MSDEVLQDLGLVEKRTYGRTSIVGMTGTITNISLCPDCGSMVISRMETEHDTFHEHLEAVMKLIVQHNTGINMLASQLGEMASYTDMPAG